MSAELWRDFLEICKVPLGVIFVRAWLGLALYLVSGIWYTFSLCSGLGVFCTNRTGISQLSDLIFFFGTEDFFLIFPLFYIPIAMVIYEFYLKPRIQ
jgi:hypothetical protein